MRRASALLALALRVALAGLAGTSAVHAQALRAPITAITLPLPGSQGQVAIEAALAQRRSVRSFATGPLSAAEASHLLWAAQGITGADGLRTAPSAGATFPLVVYLVAGRIEGIPAGLYRYTPQGHRLLAVGRTDLRAAIAAAARGQTWMQDAPALVLIAAQPGRTAARYGPRADRFVAMEAGAAAQNVLLQAVALGLGATLGGAFDEAALGPLLTQPEGEQVMAIIPVGRRR
jgi:SagB-type dehydrogenase family enzyme